MLMHQDCYTDENPEKLLSYLSDPTIRNKVFHPLFLFMKFPGLVQLYFNSKINKLGTTENIYSKEFFFSLQKSIFLALTRQCSKI